MGICVPRLPSNGEEPRVTLPYAVAPLMPDSQNH